MLKLMCGLLTPTQGTVRAHEHLRIARYTQHFVDSLDVSMTPLELMMKRYPDETRVSFFAFAWVFLCMRLVRYVSSIPI